MRRKVGFLFICCAAIPIAVFASTAWACGALTTLKVNTSVAAPNQSITLTGANFGPVPPPRPTATAHTPVQIRWGSRTGPVVGTVDPALGKFSTSVRVPSSATPGYYVINAVQNRVDNGLPKSGSPARTVVRVQGAAVAGSTSPWGGGATPTSGGPGSPDLPLPGILLSVALLASGLTLVFRDKGKKVSRQVLGA